MPRLRAPLSVVAAALLATGPTVASAASDTSQGPTEFSLLQLNLCLSGYAGCYTGTQYPAVVEETITTIEETSPDAITVNEACSGDIARIAAETGYHYEFGTVIYNGGKLACKNPGDRGVFGIAVLTQEPITSAEGAPYDTQMGSEERRWLCVETEGEARVCTTHLAVGSQIETNEAQCQEFGAIMADLARRREATIVGGDFNRQTSCAPNAAWTERDEEAVQAPGIQHVSAVRPGFVRPRDKVVPMTYTDHDGLLVHVLKVH